MKHPIVIWLYGRPGAGKTSIANELYQKLSETNPFVKLLDGDELRRGINSNLGFTDADRNENIRRSAEVAKLFHESGFTVICSFITPSEHTRNVVREIIDRDSLKLIYLNASFDTCRKRDPKGLYKKAEQGLIPNFTGIQSLFEVPSMPEITIDSESISISESTEYIIKEITKDWL